MSIWVVDGDITLAQFDYAPFQNFYGLENLRLTPNSENTSKAPVVIDGRRIFSVSQSTEQKAAERAENIETKLKNAIKSSESLEVSIRQENNYPVIYLNDNYLFTVTSDDTLGSETIQTRAEQIRDDIDLAIALARQERSTDYLQQRGIIAVAILLVALILSRFIDRLQKYPLRTAIKKIIPGFPNNDSSQPSSLTTLYRVKLGFIQFILWIITILTISELFPLTRQWRYRIFNLFNNSVFDFSGYDFSIIDLVILIALLIAVIIGSGYVTNLLRVKILQATRISRGLQEVILIVTKYGLITISVIILLQAYGLNLSSLAIIGSALGVGIGFGFQDIAKNFGSGLVLLFERTIQVGDFIQVGEHLGTVERVGARSIVLQTLDRISVIVPNSRFLTDEVINWSHRNSAARLHIPVGVAYGTDVDKFKLALLKAAEEHLEILSNPKPQVFFTGFGDSSLDFELLVWVANPSIQVRVKSDLYFSIEAILRKQDIEIPFPQRDLHLRTGNLPITLTPQLENHLLHLLKRWISDRQTNGKK
ncbi:mechanosensitive ion channel family protein [Myxosarcina sp. GI1]|uniref:mechanosensitive ion channel family protein n=1 Tax=Myxosarcina sp. GI1 TaxID=1541065 RepID=UPI00155AA3DD|nr:mechanosensitive ion channel domain-containing protein [Myxosarcina sp. GI1]